MAIYSFVVGYIVSFKKEGGNSNMRISAFQLMNNRMVLSMDTEITKKDLAILTALVATSTIANPIDVMAAIPNESMDITAKITKASQPIKDLLIGIADPVCYLVFTWGLLEAMLGKGSSGLTRMKYAALGYAGMNWLPVLMDILRSAKP